MGSGKTRRSPCLQKRRHRGAVPSKSPAKGNWTYNNELVCLLVRAKPFACGGKRVQWNAGEGGGARKNSAFWEKKKTREQQTHQKENPPVKRRFCVSGMGAVSLNGGERGQKGAEKKRTPSL